MKERCKKEIVTDENEAAFDPFFLLLNVYTKSDLSKTDNSPNDVMKL